MADNLKRMLVGRLLSSRPSSYGLPGGKNKFFYGDRKIKDRSTFPLDPTKVTTNHPSPLPDDVAYDPVEEDGEFQREVEEAISNYEPYSYEYTDTPDYTAEEIRERTVSEANQYHKRLGLSAKEIEEATKKIGTFPSILMAIMEHESGLNSQAINWGGRHDTQAGYYPNGNPIPLTSNQRAFELYGLTPEDGGAVGLIQWTGVAIRGLNKYLGTNLTKTDIYKMHPRDQLNLAVKYFEYWKKAKPNANFYDPTSAAMTVFLPAYNEMYNDDDFFIPETYDNPLFMDEDGNPTDETNIRNYKNYFRRRTTQMGYNLY